MFKSYLEVGAILITEKSVLTDPWHNIPSINYDLAQKDRI